MLVPSVLYDRPPSVCAPRCFYFFEILTAQENTQPRSKQNENQGLAGRAGLSYDLQYYHSLLLLLTSIDGVFVCCTRPAQCGAVFLVHVTSVKRNDRTRFTWSACPMRYELTSSAG